MFVEINGALQSLRVVSRLVEAHKSLRNYNELSAAVAEVNAKLIAAQSVALTSQEQQAALTQRIGELEKEVMELKNWEREAKRYQLTTLAPGVTAYALKLGMEKGEAPHYLCTNCYHKREKSILQSKTAGEKILTYACPRCKTDFPIEGKQATFSVATPTRR